MPIVGIIPLVVAGGVVKKFSDSMLGEPRRPREYGRSRPPRKGLGRGIPSSRCPRATYPSKHRPF